MIRGFSVAMLGAALTLTACASFDASPSAKQGKTPDVIETATRNAAQAAEAAYDYQTAAASWNALYQRHPDDPALALAVARNLRYAGQSQPAIAVAGGFLQQHGPSAGLLAELGKDYLAADRLPLAERTLRRATEAAPKDWQILSALGVSLDYQAKYADAQAIYARALELSPDNPAILNNLGLSQAEAGQLAAGQATLQKAADQPGATAQVRQNLALLKALGGDIGDAERLSRQDLSPEAVRANSAYYRLLAGAARVP